MLSVNVHHVTTRKGQEPKHRSANIKIGRITVLGFAISATTPSIIGTEGVEDSR